MKRRTKPSPYVDSLLSISSLGEKISHCRQKQNIYAQGTPAHSLFYIQEGGVRLTTRAKYPRSAVTTILGAGDFFGELCLAGFPLRMSTAVTLTASSLQEIKKETMIRMLQRKKKVSTAFVSHLLANIKSYQDHVTELLTSSAEQRLALLLLRLARLDKRRPGFAELPSISQKVLAEMTGTTRPRVNLFLNRFKKRGFISYNGRIEVHKSLQKVPRRR